MIFCLVIYCLFKSFDVNIFEVRSCEKLLHLIFQLAWGPNEIFKPLRGGPMVVQA